MLASMSRLVSGHSWAHTKAYPAQEMTCPWNWLSGLWATVCLFIWRRVLGSTTMGCRELGLLEKLGLAVKKCDAVAWVNLLLLDCALKALCPISLCFWWCVGEVVNCFCVLFLSTWGAFSLFCLPEHSRNTWISLILATWIFRQENCLLFWKS